MTDVDQGQEEMGTDEQAAAAREALIAAADLSLTTTAAARARAGRWSKRTCEEYLKAVKLARDWWSSEQRAARKLAEDAGIDGIPAADAAAFMPWSPDRLVRYVSHLAEQGLAVRTIRKNLTALKAWHRLQARPVPDGEPASEALQKYDRIRKAEGRGPKHAEPVSADVALRLFAAAARNPKVLAGTRDSALLGLVMGAMLTPARLVELNRGDVEQAGDTLRVRRIAGTDEWVELAHWRVGDEHEPSLCPVECVAAWCGYLDSRDVAAELPLLRAVDQHENVGGFGAFAGQTDGFGRMDEQGLGVAVRRLATGAGIDPWPTMTELRMGGIVKRRADGSSVADLAGASGVESLLRYVVLAEATG